MFGIKLFISHSILVNGTYLDSIFLEQMYVSKNISCLLSSVALLQISSLTISYSSLLSPSDLSPSITVDNLTETLQLAINTKINETIWEILTLNPCPAFAKSTQVQDETLIDWSVATYLKYLDNIVNHWIGVSGLNTFLGCLTYNTGSLVFSPSHGHTVVLIDGINSFSELSLLSPEASSQYSLNNALTVGTAENPFRISLTSALPSDPINSMLLTSRRRQLNQETPSIPPGWEIAMSMEYLHLSLDLIAKVSMGFLGDLQVQQLGVKGCGTKSILNFFLFPNNHKIMFLKSIICVLVF